jgi:hypothetical protein
VLFLKQLSYFGYRLNKQGEDNGFKMKKHSVDGQNFMGNRKEECLVECLCHTTMKHDFQFTCVIN